MGTSLQDGALPHRAKSVQQWWRRNVTDYIDKDGWLPSSPDINPLDYYGVQVKWPKDYKNHNIEYIQMENRQNLNLCV